MKAMILAAGRGERMRPLTDTCPKPLLKVRGRPLIVWHILNLVKAGITDIVINHAHLGHMLEEELGDGSKYGARIAYSREEKALETAGGIANALHLLGDAPFLVLSGDIYCPYFDFEQVKDVLPDNDAIGIPHARDKRDVCWLYLTPNPFHNLKGDFALNMYALSNEGEPKWNFSNIGVYRPEMFKGITPGESAKLGLLMREFCDKGQVGGELYEGPWVNVGTVAQLEELNAPPKAGAFAARRARVCAHMQPGAVAILPTAPAATRNSDTEYPYRHDSYFYYLTGFTEPDSVLVLIAAQGDKPAQSIMFCREKNLDREIWDGFRHGPEGARASFGFDQAFAIEDLDAEISRLLSNVPAVYYALGHSATLDLQMKTWLQNVRRTARTGVTAPTVAHDLLVLLDEMRLFKDDGEQATMLRAATMSAGAHTRAMRSSRPGMFEYEIEAELLHEFRRHGAQFPAYTPIVAAGANACVLHYNVNNAQSRDGDLILIDAGCELDSYASDITRTYPVNGRFSAPQRELYELVLAAQSAALAQVKPGNAYSSIHDAALRVLVQGMLDTGLIAKGKYGSVDDAIADRGHIQFYMHGTGHWLGLDVHDVGNYRDITAADKPSRPLEPGMVLTVEPGIYVRPAPGVPEQFWNIGIRIEDDILVTPDGHQNLSIDAPKTVADIEHTMRQS